MKFRTVRIGDATLIHGDCREVLPTLGKVDAVVTDPPYGVNLGKCGDPRGGRHGMRHAGYRMGGDDYETFVRKIVPCLHIALALARRGLVWTGPHIHEQAKPDAIGGVYCPAGTGRHGWGFKQFLPVLLYGLSPTVAKGRGATCRTAFESSERLEPNGHPCPKPLGWMEWSVRLASLEDETILDPFMGSGTTGVAALQLGRKFIGIELDKTYFDIAVKRIREAYRATSAPSRAKRT